MEEYEHMESDAFDAFDATATSGGLEHGATSQNGQMKVGLERNRPGNTGVLEATSGTAAKQSKMGQETRVTARAGKTAEAAVKHVATQELQMEEWKQEVMLEVAHELQAIRKAQQEAMEVQRRAFQLELERVKGDLELAALRSTALEKELESLRTQNPA